MLVRYRVGTIVSITSVADVCFSDSNNRIDFTPVSECVDGFYIPNCHLADFETISVALRQCGFVHLDALGYKVYFD